MRCAAFRWSVLLCLIVVSSATAGEGWTRYSAPDYGFSMLVPSGAEIEEREWPGGWGGLYSKHEGVELIAVALLDDEATAEEIEKFGIEVTRIGEDHWTQIDKGEDSAGWKWYRTVKARTGGRVAFGGYGVGRKGSYLLLLVTTQEDFDAYRSDYEHWYESVRLE